MLQSEFEALKIGDKVVYNGALQEYHECKVGEVITRVESWLDCSSTMRFDHTVDWDFFSADQIDLIKEVE
jgi:hypothetical protein